MNTQPPRNDQARREELYGLEGVRLDAYDAVVRPDRVFTVRTYTLRRWAPLLGATGFWLLVTLQQQCYKNPQGADWCTISRPVLAKKAAISEATVHRYLHATEYEDSGLCHWIQTLDPKKVRRRPRRWSNQAGRMVQPPNRYQVVMDAPLAPVDQRGMARILQENGAGPGVLAKEITPVLEQLATLSLPTLLDLCDEKAGLFEPPSTWEEEGFYSTVADVVTALGIRYPDDTRERDDFLELCSRAQQAFVHQVHLGTQYYLQQWMPSLGHKLALAVVQLRSLCYWGPEEKRDEVKVNFTILADLSGCSARWLRTINETHPLSREFFVIDSLGRGKPPVFHVTLLEPIAPQDRDEYESLLNFAVVVPESGQLGFPIENC